MTDIDLLMFGCAISFIALGGFYVYARERFVYTEEARERQPVPVRAQRQTRNEA